MKVRFISALVIALIAIPFILIGNLYFDIFILVIGLAALYEFLKFRKQIPKFIKFLTYLLLGVTILKDLIGMNIEHLIIINIFLLLGSLIFINNKYHYKDAFYLIGLVLFLGLTFSKVILIRNLGLNYLIYLLLIAVATDSFALFIGSKFGKIKLAPTISPNKTIEGLIGGLIVGTTIGSIYYITFINNAYNIFIIILLTFVLSLVGEIGDLIKSCIKRYEKVKDFSNLIPGHGGIMDRFDSLIFIVLMYTLIRELGGLIWYYRLFYLF